jgi:flagellar biosynthesis/type III secretory pathway protein FliH
MPLTHLTLDELQQHAAAKPDDPELVAEVMARFTAGGLISVEEAENRIEDARADGFDAGREAAQAAQMEYDGGYSDGYDAGFEEGFNKASGRIA